MPAAVARDQGKSTFIKQTLFEDPYSNAAKINKLWSESGREGSISVTLVNKMRSEMGLTGNLRGRRRSDESPATEIRRPYTGKKRGRKPKSASAAVAVEEPLAATFRGRNARLNRLTEVEAEIDRLLFKVMSIDGLAEVETALRQARRHLYRVMG
jgi:hypothetical protein